jgi:autotransporter translocation and assembly factor TamB
VRDVMLLDARGTITGTDLPGFGAHVPRMALGVNIAAGTLKVDADGSFDRLDPAVLLGRKEIAGRAAGTVKGSVVIARLGTPVTLDTLAADGTVSLADSTIGGLNITSGELQGQYASRGGTITRLTLTGPDLSVESSGRLALNSSPRPDPQGGSNLTYHIDAKNLGELARILGQDGFSGSATLDGTVTGNGTLLTTAGQLVGNKVSYRDQTALNMNSKYTVTVPDLQFANTRLEATTNAAPLTIGGVEVQEMNATTTYANRTLDFTTDLKEGTRELSGTGKIIFHPDHQEVHLPVLALRSQGIEWRTVPGTDATIQYGNGRLEMQGVRLANGDQELLVAGPLALQGEKTSGSLDVVAGNVDLAQLETLLLTNHGLSGRLSANAKITGTVDAPTVDGHAEVRNGGFRDYRYQSLVADVDYTGNRIGFDARLQQSATEFITARGSVPRTLFRPSGGEHVAASAGDQIDLRLQSNALGLGFVQGLTTLVTNVRGTIQADLAVTGSGLDPHVAGTIDIKAGAFSVPSVGVSYTGLDTRIDLTPDAVHLQRFRLMDDHGASLTISGDLGVHERRVGAINITAQSDDFEVMDNELGRVAADSLLVLTGELRRPRIVGDIRLDSGRLELDRILQLFYDPYSVEAIPDEEPVQRVISAAGSAQEATRAALNQAQQGLAPVPELPAAPRKTLPASARSEAVSVDVQVHIPDNLIVRGNKLRPSGPTGASLGDINVTVGGDVRVRKDEGGPFTFIGPIRTVRGTYQFQGRQFEIVRDGTIRFIGQSPPDPLIDVTAARTVPGTGVEARVRITGSVKSPELTLSSTPPLDESDILSLIVFNRTVNDLGTGERAALASTAGGIATGFLVDPLTQSIGKALDLDIFEITPVADEGDLGAGITIGKQVWDRAFLKMRQQFGERNWTEFLIEYQLASFLRMHGSFAPETSGSANRLTQRRIEKVGVDMIFFFSY